MRAQVKAIVAKMNAGETPTDDDLRAASLCLCCRGHGYLHYEDFEGPPFDLACRLCGGTGNASSGVPGDDGAGS